MSESSSTCSHSYDHIAEATTDSAADDAGSQDGSQTESKACLDLSLLRKTLDFSDPRLEYQ